MDRTNRSNHLETSNAVRGQSPASLLADAVMLSLSVKKTGFELLSMAMMASNSGPKPVRQPVLTHTSFSILR